MGINKYEVRMLSAPSVRSRSGKSDSVIKEISDINAYSTPGQIAVFVSLKMKEFIEAQLSEDKANQFSNDKSCAK